MKRVHSRAGVSLVEVIIAVSIIAIALVAIGYSINAYVEARAALLTEVKATYLAEEGYELVRSIRDDEWSTLDVLALDTLHYLDVTNNSASVTATPEVIDTDFTRSFELHELYRDGNSDIVESTAPGAAIDDEGRWLEVHVHGPNGTTTFEAIITNIYAAS